MAGKVGGHKITKIWQNVAEMGRQIFLQLFSVKTTELLVRIF
jgi:hypothetical protein